MLNKFLFSVLPMALVAFALLNDARGNETFEGTIVETSDNTVTIHDLHTGEYQMFVVESDTDILLNGEPARLADLYPFFQVTVVAEFDGLNWIATEVDATSEDNTNCPTTESKPGRLHANAPAKGVSETSSFVSDFAPFRSKTKSSGKEE